MRHAADVDKPTPQGEGATAGEIAGSLRTACVTLKSKSWAGKVAPSESA